MHISIVSIVSNSIKSKIQSYFAIIFEPILEKNDYSKVVEFTIYPRGAHLLSKIFFP